jgi:diaminopimelate dehydrogenase
MGNPKTKIRAAVVGLGNLGRACAQQLSARKEDFDLVAVFSRRAVEGTVPLNDIEKYKGKIDVVLVCVGSSDDAPVLLPDIAKNFCTVDSFDTHAKLPEYIKSVSAAAGAKNTCIVGTGWDPGLLSVMRLYLTALLPSARTETFWGPGVSMGHTNAIKNIAGVADAIQFTVPKASALKKAHAGAPVSAHDKHKRVCYVVAAPGADRAQIEHQIKTMPNYFAPYETAVHFVSPKAFNKKYKGRSEHAGQVISADESSSARFELSLKSNARFTAQVMLAYAIANFNMARAGLHGVFTVADVAPKYLFSESRIDLV